MSMKTPASEVRIAKGIAYKIIAKKSLRTVVALAVLAAIIYAVIASTMTRYVATNLGTVKVVSANFPGGQALPGTQILIDPKGNYDNMPWTNIFMAITPHDSTMKVNVVAGPFGKVDWPKYGIDREKTALLNNEYLFECVEGCNPDSNQFGITLPSWIMGIPVAEVGQ